jgi:sporulation protein YlmC with PRC-barrel domain
MIRASGLYGRPIVDLDTAERVGTIDEVIVDPYGPGVAGFVVTRDRSLIGARKRVIVPMEAVHAIGPDALTLRSVGRPDDHAVLLDGLPRLSELTGRRMVSFGGRLLGAMEDALIDEQDGRIIGYPLERSGPGSWFDYLFGLRLSADRTDYVRADAALRIGARLIVVPDDAIASVSDLEESAREERRAIPAPPVPEAADRAPSFDHTPAEVRSAAATTSPFSLDEIRAEDDRDRHDEPVREVTDEGLGLDAGHRDVDPEEDTGLIAPAGTPRYRPQHRPQAERMR